jgi:DNA-directed RNA polymerase subunit RPC12/RpoP
MKIAGNYVCPNCDWKGEESEAIKSPECPKCGDEYLRVIE